MPNFKFSRLEVQTVIIEMIIMGLFAWSFTVGPPSEAFMHLMESWGVVHPQAVILFASLSCLLLAPFTLAFRSRMWQRIWYKMCLGPMVLYAASIGYYRAAVEPGNATVIIIYLAFVFTLWALADATFRDLKVRE